MSVTVSKTDGVTVLTLTSDPHSPCPPLCQILTGLCYSPTCYSVSPRLRRAQRSQSVLGTLQIIIGLMNVGLGILLCVSPGSSWQMDSSAFPFWLAALFILFGVMCIVSEKYPSPCLVTLTVILNITGVGFAIAAIVLYSLNMADIYLWGMCRRDDYYWYDRTTPSPSREDSVLMDKCLEAKEMLLMLLRGINGVMIVLSVVELCVVISAAVLGIKTLRSKEKATKPEVAEDPELYNPLLEEGSATPTA